MLNASSADSNEIYERKNGQAAVPERLVKVSTMRSREVVCNSSDSHVVLVQKVASRVAQRIEDAFRGLGHPKID